MSDREMPIDWARVKARLRRAVEGLDEALTLSPERSRRVMEERARRLAVRPDAVELGSRIDLVRFAIGDGRYAIETRWVREVVRLRASALLPGAPDFMPGAAALRGELIPLIDLERFLGMAARGVGGGWLIALGVDGPELGIAAEEMLEVGPIAEAAIAAGPATLPVEGKKCVRGVTADALVVLDGGAILRDPRIFEQDQARG